MRAAALPLFWPRPAAPESGDAGEGVGNVGLGFRVYRVEGLGLRVCLASVPVLKKGLGFRFLWFRVSGPASTGFRVEGEVKTDLRLRLI